MSSLKVGICPFCDDSTPKMLISGLCEVHIWADLQAAVERTRPTRSVETQEDPLQTWYRKIVAIHKNSFRCWNCREPIRTSAYKYAKACVAHILPKRDFLSIQTHNSNYLILGTLCGCHSKYDRDWPTAARMDVFPLAVERFQIFYPSIALPERTEIPEIFTIFNQ